MIIQLYFLLTTAQTTEDKFTYTRHEPIGVVVCTMMFP